MKKLLSIMIVLGLLVGCNKEEVKGTVKKDTVKEENKQEKFNPEAFLKEAKKHDIEWYVAESAKLTKKEIAELEKYKADQDAKEQEAYKTILQTAKTKESVNDEGQKVIEYEMVNTLGHDADFFQLQWKEGSEDNYSQPSEKVKDGQVFKLIVDPAFDKSLDDIDLNTLKLTGS
ncbi:hypothetical protein [Neobacillus vireti]|uniref:hypothetical protein n=1 Tax=Neobacillus vireti TaxID=220686 RepID=UPI002FFFD838